MMRQQNQPEETAKTPPRALTPPAETAEVIAPPTENVATDLSASKIANLVAANRKRRRNLAWMGAAVSGMVLILPTLLFLIVRNGNPNSPLAHTLLGLLFANYFCLIAMLPGTLEGHNRAVKLLTNTDDLRAVGPLAEALSGSDTANSIAGAVLIRLLPQLRPEDATLLTPWQRKCLRDALRHAANPRKYTRYNPTLAVAILNALTRIGDAEDLPVLETVAARPATTAEQQQLHSVATACLAHLQARLAGEELPEGLHSAAEQALPATATRLTPQAVEVLSSQLRGIARLRSRNVRITLAGALSGMALAALSLASGGTSHPPSPLLLTGLLGSMGTMVFFAARGMYEQRNLTQALMHTGDLRIVGPLVEAAASSEVSGDIAAMALTPLLSRLQASDVGLLDATARDSLNQALLRQRGNTDFVLAALQALQQIGDARALPFVQKLAERADRSVAGQSVREAALACLPFLELRAAQDRASQTLLRASAASATPPDALLRPVEETPQAAQMAKEELLRPGIAATQVESGSV